MYQDKSQSRLFVHLWMFSFVNKSIKRIKQHEMRNAACSHFVIKAGFQNNNTHTHRRMHTQTSCFSNYTGKEDEPVCVCVWTSVALCLAFLSETAHHSSRLVCKHRVSRSVGWVWHGSTSQSTTSKDTQRLDTFKKGKIYVLATLEMYSKILY